MTAQQSRVELGAIAAEAVGDVTELVRRTSGSPEERRLLLLDAVPAVVDYYGTGSAALAADFYDETRDIAGVKAAYATSLIIPDRVVKIRRGVAWASDPFFTGDDAGALARLSQIVSTEVARPYRATILGNRVQDPESVGWMRITSPSGCGFCRMLAAKGAIYKKTTATFAAHDHCTCTAAPVFRGGAMGPEASADQYLASKRSRTPAEKARLRDAIAVFEGD